MKRYTGGAESLPPGSPLREAFEVVSSVKLRARKA
jgi:hypothetical protein